jgi:hypothetical protein
MGVDCKIVLPGNVRIKDVANVIGLAAGLKGEMYSDKTHGASWATVEGVETKPLSSLEGMAEISLCGDLIDKWKHHFVIYHFEAYGSGRLLSPRSTAFWIACGHRLVDFFGGKMDINDCDEIRVDYSVPKKPNNQNCPRSDRCWDDFQKRILSIKPITWEELEEFDLVAAYKMGEIKGE